MRSGEEMGRDERYDSMMDRALRSYAEPAEVLETRVALARVMERVRASEAQRRGWMWGAVGAVGLTVMVLVGVLWMTRGARRAEIAWTPRAPGVLQSFPQRLTGSDRVVESVPRQAESREAKPVVRISRVREERSTEALPKQEVFPTPRPLSEQEQSMVAFADTVPPHVQQQVVDAQQHMNDPIAIAELKIAPLESGGKNSNEPENSKER